MQAGFVLRFVVGTPGAACPVSPTLQNRIVALNVPDSTY